MRMYVVILAIAVLLVIGTGTTVFCQEAKSVPFPKCVKINLIVPSADGSVDAVVSSDSPIFVNVNVRNECSVDFPLTSVPRFSLTRLDVAKNPEAKRIASFHPPKDSDWIQTESLRPGTAVTISVDIAALDWGTEISAFMPSQRMSELIGGGKYVLVSDVYLRLNGEAVTVVSNPIELNFQAPK